MNLIRPKSQYLNCGILHEKVFKVLIICFLYFNQYSIAQSQFLSEKPHVNTIYSSAKDLKFKTKPEAVDKKLFATDRRAIPDLGWGKFKAWLRVDLRYPKQKKKYLLIQNPVFDELNFYNKNGLVENITYATEINERRVKFRFPVFLVSADSSFYISGISKLNPAKFPIRLFDEKGFAKFKENEAFKNGILLGILAFLILINGILFTLFRIGSFLIFLISALCFGLLYCFLEGYLFGKPFSSVLFENRWFNFQYVIYGAYQLSSYWFFHSVFQQQIRPYKFLYTAFRLLVFLGIIETAFMILSPFWFDHFSDYGIKTIGIIIRLSTFLMNVLLFVILLKIKNKSHLAFWFLIGLLPVWLVYILPRFMPFLFVNAWFTMPQLYSLATLWYICLISFGILTMVYHSLRKELVLEIPEASKAEEKKSVLSAREMEILLAFTNGFSYTEISNAMFISPHTVRTHLKNIYSKIDVNSKAEAVRWVIENY